MNGRRRKRSPSTRANAGGEVRRRKERSAGIALRPLYFPEPLVVPQAHTCMHMSMVAGSGRRGWGGFVRAGDPLLASLATAPPTLLPAMQHSQSPPSAPLPFIDSAQVRPSQ